MATKPAEGGESFTNYVAYKDPRTTRSRIGHYDSISQTIQPLSFISGTPIDNLYQVIEVGEVNIISSGEPIAVSSVKILPPLADRDVLCVGKNYAEHAKEFNSSGFDSSDKVDQPSHPVIFTKRFTSIIADGDEIYPHPKFTQTADYEGEIGVIIGKPGFRISEEDAMSHVWGYTIINDMTARERQRDHKQFYIGKSADTFCPMGPIAVPAWKLDKVLRVQTHVNGELRQDATIEELIFSIPTLIKTLSEGQTLMSGDVLATGTPAGVGIGKKPPLYLKSGDTIAVSVTSLGTLTNRVADPTSRNPITKQVQAMSRLQPSNAAKSIDVTSLTTINNKPLFYKNTGEGTGPPVIFVHGLGSSNEYFSPLIQSLKLQKSHSLHLFDFEGHGLSPTSPLSKLSISSLAEDLDGIFLHAKVDSGATIIAQSMGCFVAVQFALSYPRKVSKIILLGPPVSPLPSDESQAMHKRADTARTKGMTAVVDDVVANELSERTKASNPLAFAAVRMSLLSQDPEGYAKACTALTEAEQLDFEGIEASVMIATGSDDHISPPSLSEEYAKRMKGGASVKALEDIGHWHIFEDAPGVAKAVKEFML